MEFIGNFVSNVLDLMGFSGLADNVRSLFEDIKSKITTPIESAKGIVDSAVSKIKGFFPISIGRILDNISLPHFEVYGGEFPYGIGGSGSPPSFDVWWGANGGIMNQPTLFGAGEAGPEAIMPLDPFWERMDNMADSIIQSVDSANSGEIVVNLYMYPNGPQMDQQIVRAYDRGKRRGLK